MVAELKELGITVKDEFVVNLASIIENDLLSEEEQNNESPKEIIVEKQEEKQIVNPFIEIAKNWKPCEHKDHYRIPQAGPKGGIPLTDPKALSQLRAVAKELLKSIGKKVLQGNFNLTTISFPIKCMMPSTSLHNTMRSMTLAPLYFNRAALSTNPIERLRLITIGSLATYQNTSTFLKPVKPK